MGLECVACGTDLGDYPRDDVFDGERKEVVARHTSAWHGKREEYYCDYECLMAEMENDG